MFKTYKQFLVLVYFISLLYQLKGQVPSFGGCPKYEPMLDFSRDRFMGTWYEVQRYFAVSELAGRCISATYIRHPDNTLWVNNAVTNRL